MPTQSIHLLNRYFHLIEYGLVTAIKMPKRAIESPIVILMLKCSHLTEKALVKIINRANLRKYSQLISLLSKL